MDRSGIHSASCIADLLVESLRRMMGMVVTRVSAQGSGHMLMLFMRSGRLAKEWFRW